MIATAQDTLDIVLPSSGLEYIKVETGIVGLVGAITSVLGACMYSLSQLAKAYC
jgi:peroxin-11B